MWDLSSPTRDRTRAPAEEAWSLNHWTSREVPLFLSLNLYPIWNLSGCSRKRAEIESSLAINHHIQYFIIFLCIFIDSQGRICSFQDFSTMALLLSQIIPCFWGPFPLFVLIRYFNWWSDQKFFLILHLHLPTYSLHYFQKFFYNYLIMRHKVLLDADLVGNFSKFYGWV